MTENETPTALNAIDSEDEHTPQRPDMQGPLSPAPIVVQPERPPACQWRLVDAWSFIYKGVIRLVRMDDFQNVDVIAISYTWSTDIKNWREKIVQLGSGRTYEDKILRGSACVTQGLRAGSLGMDGIDQASIARAHLFFTAVAFFVFTRGKKFFWIDILCIDQEETSEQQFFVPRMAMLYNNCYETHAYPLGTEIAPSINHQSVRKPIWETRAWTVQEQVLAKRVMYCYLFLGDVADALRKAIGDTSADDETEVDRRLNSPVLDHFQYKDRVYVLRRGEHVMTCHMEVESPFGNFTGTNVVEDDWGTDRFPDTVARSVRYRNILALRKSVDTLVKARLCLEMLPIRNSTYSEDMIYSALGAFDMESFVPEYGIGFEEARLRVFESMGSTVLAHLLGTDWRSNEDGVHKDTSLPRIVGGAPTVGVTYLQSSIQDCKYDRKMGTKLRCRAERWRIWRPPENILGMTALTRLHLRNDRLIIVQGTVYDERLPVSLVPSVPTTRSQPERTKIIVIDGLSIGVDDKHYSEGTQDFEQLVEFVEVGCCRGATPLAINPDTAFSEPFSLVVLHTNRLESGNHRNMGTVLIDALDAFTSEFADVVIE